MKDTGIAEVENMIPGFHLELCALVISLHSESIEGGCVMEKAGWKSIRLEVYRLLQSWQPYKPALISGFVIQ